MSAQVAILPGGKKRRRRPRGPAEIVDLAEQRHLFGLRRRVEFVTRQLRAGAMHGAEALVLLHQLQAELTGPRAQNNGATQ